MKQKFISAINLSKEIFNNDNFYNYKSSDFVVIVDDKIKLTIEFGNNKFKIYYGENSNFEYFNYHLVAKKFKHIEDIEYLRKKFFSKFTYLEITNNYYVTLSDKSIENYQKLDLLVDRVNRYPELIISKTGEFLQVLTIENFQEQFLYYLELLKQFLNNKEKINERKEYEIIYYNAKTNEIKIKDLSDLEFFPYSEYKNIHLNTKKKIAEKNISIEMRYVNYLSEKKYPLIIVAYDDKKNILKYPKVIIDDKVNSMINYLDGLFYKNLYDTITVYNYDLYMLLRNYLKGFDVEIVFSSEQSLFDYIFDDYEYIINKNGL